MIESWNILQKKKKFYILEQYEKNTLENKIKTEKKERRKEILIEFPLISGMIFYSQKNAQKHKKLKWKIARHPPVHKHCCSVCYKTAKDMHSLIINGYEAEDKV